jgi:4-hydroxy-tetrahydrodipicolinate synthase
MPLMDALYTANHPAPLKEAMAFIGHPVGQARSPLQRPSGETLQKAKAALEKLAAFTFK